MTKIPNIQSILIKIVEAFGEGTLQTVEKRRFINQEDQHENHISQGIKLLRQLVEPLSLHKDPELFEGFCQACEEFINWYSAVETNTRTFDASNEQVLWTILSYQIMPGWGRKYGFWSSAAPVVEGMPRGDLWFLPQQDPTDRNKVLLPVQIFVKWWLDLLDCNLEDIWQDENAESRIRSLQNWRKGMLPEPGSFFKYFSGKKQFCYKGTFADNEDLELDERFLKAFSFVTHVKKISLDDLLIEIPRLNENVVKAVRNKSASDQEKLSFIKAIALRWKRPDNETVYRRLLLARALQYGYERIVKLITPDVSPFCSNPEKNLVLQQIQLFKYVFDLTIEADEHTQSEETSNLYFRTRVPTELAREQLQSIISLDTGNEFIVSNILTNKFKALSGFDPIENMFTDGKIEKGSIFRAVNVDRLAEHQNIEKLLSKTFTIIQSQKINRYDEFESLIHQLKSLPLNQVYEADILFANGRHLINQNKTEEGLDLFDQAFELCKKTSYGILRKNIAEACLACRVANQKFSHKNEKYIRVLLNSVDRDDPMHKTTAEYEKAFADFSRDKSRQLNEWYWKEFYKPYNGITALLPIAILSFKSVLKGLFEIDNDTDRHLWFQKNKKSLSQNLNDVDGNTFLVMYMKMMIDFPIQLPPTLVPHWNNLLPHLKRTMILLAKNLPLKTIEAADAKGQTALMLAVTQRNQELLDVLLERKADINAQDYRGQTALREAAQIRDQEIFIKLLQHGGDLIIKAKDGYSPLESAVIFGVVGAVDYCLKEHSSQLSTTDKDDLKFLTKAILESYDNHRKFFATQGRKVAPKKGYIILKNLLDEEGGNT